MHPASYYTSRGGLQPGDPTFVGRSDLLRRLIRAIDGAERVNSIILCGPKRSGKTSILQQLLHRPTRASYSEAVEAWSVGYVDLSNRPRELSALRRRLVEAAAAAIGVRFDTELLERIDYLEGLLQDLLDGVSAPLILVIDEFDRVAPDLRSDDLGELRAAASGISGIAKKFAFVFAVERDPSQAIEDTQDPMSDLLKVLLPVHIRQCGLPIADAHRLVGIGRTATARPRDPASEQHLVEQVGRHPLLLQAACHAWYDVVDGVDWTELGLADRERADAEVADAFADQVRHVMASLHPGTFALLRHDRASAECRKELAALGLEGQLFERYLAELPTTVSPNGRSNGLFGELERLRVAAGRGPDEVVLPRNTYVYLKRQVTNERDAEAFFASLSRVIAAYRPFMAHVAASGGRNPLLALDKDLRLPRQPGETLDHWCLRHLDDIVAFLCEPGAAPAVAASAEAPRRARFVVLTIKEEEADAMMTRLRSGKRHNQKTERHDRFYFEVFSVENARRERFDVVVGRCSKQGNLDIQQLAAAAIAAYTPSCLIVTGIAGAAPAGDLTLGDVIVSNQILDLRVSAIGPGAQWTYAVDAGRIDRRIEPWIANLYARRSDELKRWNAGGSLRKPPAVDLVEGNFTARDAVLRGATRTALERSFGADAGSYTPRYVVGAIASTDTLMKDPDHFRTMAQGARQIAAVDMESAGAFATARATDTPFIAVRGISDVIGFRRDEAWTRYACVSAAAFCYAMLRMAWPEPI